jgi:hypothetical protein
VCGSCLDGYTFNSALGLCVACESAKNTAPIIVVCILCLLGLAVLALRRSQKFKCDSCFGYLHLSTMHHIDKGTLKVLWSTTQIISSVQWNLSLQFPAPFSRFLGVLSFLQFDFFYSPITSHNSPSTNAIQCVSGKNSFYNRVYVTQFFPIFLFAFIAFVGVLREFASVCRGGRAGHSQWQRIFNEHVYAALVLSYVVLPTVAALQFKALRCETLDHDGSSFLKEDSAVSCLSASYAHFRAIVILGIVVYQSIPLLWFVLLWHVRRDLNPLREALESALEVRKKKAHLMPYFFLFSDYLPSMWAYEVYDMCKEPMSKQCNRIQQPQAHAFS